jgi:hypothetical protein
MSSKIDVIAENFFWDNMPYVSVTASLPHRCGRLAASEKNSISMVAGRRCAPMMHHGKLSFTAHQSCECDSSWLNFKFYIRRRPRAGQLRCMHKANGGERETRWKIDFTLKQSSRGKKFFSSTLTDRSTREQLNTIVFMHAAMQKEESALIYILFIVS